MPVERNTSKVTSIARRVATGFTAVLLLSILASSTVFVLARNSLAGVTHYEKTVANLNSTVLAMQADFYNYDDQMNMYVAVLIGGSQAALAETTYQQALQAGQSLGGDLHKAEKLTSNAQLLRSLKRVSADYQGYNSFVAQVRQSAQVHNYSHALYLQTVGNLVPSNDMMPALTAAQTLTAGEAQSALNALHGQQTFVEEVSLASIALTIALIAALGMLLVLYVFRPLTDLRGGIEEASRNDGAGGGRIDVKRRDEIGLVGEAFNAMLDSLERRDADLVGARAEREEHLKEKFGMQQAAQEALRKRAQEMIDQTASAVTSELSEVLDQVAAVRAAAGTIDERVTEVDSLTRGAVQQADRMNLVLATLSDSLDQVGNMTRLIAEVSDQTKLLALNATIEAARAGDAGHGFSVVANEVKELATTTASSTDQISSTVASLAESARDISDAIGSMTTSIAGVDESTAALARIATDQYDLVGRLDAALGETIDRLTNMTSITHKLEQRAHPRAPLSEKATVRTAGGRVIRARLNNISEGGAACILEEDANIEGETVMVDFTLGGRSFSQRAHSIHRSGGELGLQFVAPAADLIAVIRAHFAVA